MGSNLPDYMKPNQRIVRRPNNPYDRSTVVSILSKPIDEIKPTIDPGRFKIPSAKRDDFELLVVGPSSWFREINPNEPLLEIINSSAEVAASIVRDYCNSVLESNMGDAIPGLFWIPGKFDKKTILTYVETKEDPTTGMLVKGRSFADLLDECRAKQRNWYTALVAKADGDWVNSGGHPRSINSDMKVAANELGLDRPWLATVQALMKSNCPACGHMVDMNYAVCSNCKVVINQERAKELGLKFAS